MSDNRQPTRPPTAQRRQATAATYPLIPITGKARWQPPAQPHTAAELLLAAKRFEDKHIPQP